MSTGDLAPYATGPTTILVYKGRGILVKRCISRDSAIVDAIKEFEIPVTPRRIYLTSYVGKQGQEVEISRSGFGCVKDTVPVHVHMREEDDSAERSRWPPLLDDYTPPAAVEGLRDIRPSEELLTLRVNKNQGSRIPQESAREGSKTSESRLDSASDWHRRDAATPDTAASVRRPTLRGPPVASPIQEESLQAEGLLMASLQPGLQRQILSRNGSSNDQQGSAPSNGTSATAWKWFKKAGSAIRATPATTISKLPQESDRHKPSPESIPGQISPRQDIPNDIPDRPPKLDKQYHRHVLSRTITDERRTSEQVTDEIRNLLQKQQSLQSDIVEETARMKVSTAGPSAAGPSESWGPGGLVLDDGLSISDNVNDDRLETKPPWWAQPVDAFDPRNSKKLGLKPLRLSKHDITLRPTADAKELKKPTSSHVDIPPVQPQRPSIGRMSSSRPPSRSQPYDIEKSPVRRRRKQSMNASRDGLDADSRPLPMDMPESPFSSRRFTRHDERFDTLTLPPDLPMNPIPRLEDPPLKRKDRRHFSPPNNTRLAEPETAVPRANTKVRPATASSPAPASLQRGGSPPDAPVADAPKARLRKEVEPTRTRRRHDGPDRTNTNQHDLPGDDAGSRSIRLPPENIPRTSDTTRTISMAPPASQRMEQQPTHMVPPTAPRRGDLKGGTFAAAALAARKQISGKGSNGGSPSSAHQCTDAQARGRGSKPPKNEYKEGQKRTSVSSLRDFVAAELAPDESRSQHRNETRRPQKNEVAAVTNSDTVDITRLVLGPIDIVSPNRKGSRLIMKASPEQGELSLEWDREKKVILSLPFDSIGALQESFMIIKPTSGEVRTILVELEPDSLLNFQRFSLVFIAGLGADIDHLSQSTFHRLADSNGW